MAHNPFRDNRTGHGVDRLAIGGTFKQTLINTRTRLGGRSGFNMNTPLTPIKSYSHAQPICGIQLNGSPSSTSYWRTPNSSSPSSFVAEPAQRQHSWREIKLRGAVKCFLKKLCSAKFAPLEDVAWRCRHCGKKVCFKCTKDRGICE